MKTKACLALATFALLGGCAHEPPLEPDTATRHARVTIDPNAEPAEPEVPRDDVPAFNTEYFLGTREAEAAQFAEFARQIQEIQRKAAASHAQPLQRGFHAKSHACLNGELRLEPHRSPRTRFGISRVSSSAACANMSLPRFLASPRR